MILLDDFIKASNITNKEDKNSKSDRDYDNKIRELDLEEKANKLNRDKDEHQLKMDFARMIFYFVCSYLGIVIAIIFLKAMPNHFILSDNVIGYLLGSTAVTVIGLLAAVIKYLFK